VSYWQNVNAPVLVMRGGADGIMSRADSDTIAQIVNQAHPGRGRYVEISGMTHGSRWRASFMKLAPLMVQWMKEHYPGCTSASAALKPCLLQVPLLRLLVETRLSVGGSRFSVSGTLPERPP
jgi:hypothetical protein